MFWSLHVVVRKSPLKQPREHLLSHTKFSDSLNIVCATFAQASYLTQLAWLEKICIGLSQLTNELQKENILILKLIIKSFSKPLKNVWLPWETFTACSIESRHNESLPIERYMSKKIDTRPRLFEGWRMSDAIHLKNLYTKDIVVRFVNIYLVDSDLAVRQLYLFYGQLDPDGWGETTIPSTLPSTIKTTYLQSSIIKKGPNPPSPLPPYWNHLWVRRVCYLTKLSRCI